MSSTSKDSSTQVYRPFYLLGPLLPSRFLTEISRIPTGDRAIPRCGRCVRAGYDCRLAFKFKSSKGKFLSVTLRHDDAWQYNYPRA